MSEEFVTDEALFADYIKGNQAAFSELLERYRKSLTFFIMGIVHDADAAEDLMIEAYARLSLAGKKFAGKSLLKTYLFTIGRNLALRYLKKKRSSGFQVENSEEFLEQLPDFNSPEKEFAEKQDKAELFKAMDQLVPQYRTVLYLVYFEKLSYEEAAKVMKTNVKTVTNNCYRAKQRLKEILS